MKSCKFCLIFNKNRANSEIGDLLLFLNRAKPRILLIKFMPSRDTRTLDYGISVPAGINMPGGTFGKTNKRVSWKIPFDAKKKDFL